MSRPSFFCAFLFFRLFFISYLEDLKVFIEREKSVNTEER